MKNLMRFFPVLAKKANFVRFNRWQFIVSEDDYKSYSHSYTVEYSPKSQTYKIHPVSSTRIVISPKSLPLLSFDTKEAKITHRRFSGVNVTSEALECIDTNVFTAALSSEYILFIPNLHWIPHGIVAAGENIERWLLQ